MDKIIQTEKLRYVKTCAERILFHDLINNWKKWKPETTRVTARPSPPLFSCQKQPPKLFSKVAFLKFRKIYLENPRRISALVVGNRPSYLQKFNCAACCPWNLEVVISRNIFNWLCWPNAATGGVLWKRVVLKHFAIFTGKHLCWSLFQIKL